MVILTTRFMRLFLRLRCFFRLRSVYFVRFENGVQTAVQMREIFFQRAGSLVHDCTVAGGVHKFDDYEKQKFRCVALVIVFLQRSQKILVDLVEITGIAFVGHLNGMLEYAP